ncbi:MAG: hypothetical protein JWM96_1036 [Alphaproteobacteria bacterium]|nr:hypothetical protein [Alphaproteobacteria bacterium]
MEMVILVIHVILALAIVGVVLLQPPENSSLGGLGASNTMAGANVRGQANILTRTTAVLAALFIITSLALALIGGHNKPRAASILDEAGTTPAATDKAAVPAPDAPKQAPSVPLSK